MTSVRRRTSYYLRTRRRHICISLPIMKQLFPSDGTCFWHVQEQHVCHQSQKQNPRRKRIGVRCNSISCRQLDCIDNLLKLPLLTTTTIPPPKKKKQKKIDYSILSHVSDLRFFGRFTDKGIMINITVNIIFG